MRLLVLPGLCLVACLHAQDRHIAARIQNVRFVNYSTGQGLSQATAAAMAQDSTGFLWVGTQDGLDRFDGYEFKVYRHHRGDRWSLSDNRVTAMAAGAGGVVWVGTQSGGLDRYDPVHDRFDRFETGAVLQAGPAAEQVTALMVDHRGWLWVALSSGTLQWLEPSSARLHETPLGTRRELGFVRAMTELGNGSVLIGGRDGLWRCDSNASHLTEVRPGDQPSLDVQSIAIAANGDFWVATSSAGLFRFNAGGIPVSHYSTGAGKRYWIPDDELRRMRFDRAGRLWIATKSRGLLRLDPKTGVVSDFRHDSAQPQSLAADRQQSVLIDSDGLVWAGSWNNGVSVHDPRTEAFSTIEWIHTEGARISQVPVNSVLAAADGTLWFGLSGQTGLVHFSLDSGVLALYRHKPGASDSLSRGTIEHMAGGVDGSIWIAFDGGGLSRLPPGTDHFVNYRHAPDDPQSLASDNVLNVMQGRDGTLWVATVDAGLDELCQGCTRFVHHRHDAAVDSSIGPGRVTTLFEDRRGDIWVGLGSGGLDRYDRKSGHFAHFVNLPDDPHSLSNNFVTMIVQDRHGGLWIGTQGGGMDHLSSTDATPLQFDSITTANGLAADAIGSIVEDAEGALWLSSTRGISRYQPSSGNVVNFNTNRGALARGYYIDSSAHLADGRIVFAGPAGATLFDPSRVTLLPSPRPVITGVLLNNEPVGQTWNDPKSPLRTSPWVGNSRVLLDHRQNNVSFEFGTTDFADPDAIEFAYRLLGHDHDWIRTEVSRRFAIYTDLAAGNYRLEVRARRDGAAWNPASAILNVRVLPAPWLSPLALAAYCSGLLVILGVTSWRTRRNWREQAKGREAIRLSEARLKYALWGSGGELWDVDLTSGEIFRENRLEHLAASHETSSHTLSEYRRFVHPEDLPALEQAVREHIKGEKNFLEIGYRSRDRNQRWCWLLTRGRVVARDADGRARRLVGTTQDITLLKRTEESLRKLNEELESRVDMRTADLRATNSELRRTLKQLTLAQRHLLESEKMAALGGLVAGVAHEINTPLGVTVTAASHLQEETARMARLAENGEVSTAELEQFRDTAQQSAQIILRNLRRADQLVRSFKLVAVDQTTEEQRDIELGAYLNEILISLGPTLKKTPHKVTVECAQPVRLRTYPGALYQIVSNLIMNSLAHAFGDGQSGSIVIDVARENAAVRIRYRDNGRGMSDEARMRIFEPFYTTRRDLGGSGLGMHVVYNLVTQLLKGKISVKSTAGKGAAFDIVLPERDPGRNAPA